MGRGLSKQETGALINMDTLIHIIMAMGVGASVVAGAFGFVVGFLYMVVHYKWFEYLCVTIILLFLAWFAGELTLSVWYHASEYPSWSVSSLDGSLPVRL